MKLLRAGLCLLFAFSVLAHGVVEVWSESVLEIGSVALLVFWAFIAYFDKDAKILWSPLNWPILGFIGIGLVQLQFRATAYPFLTRVELLRFAAYFIVFFLVAQAFQGRAAMTTLAWFLILLCFGVSLVGIIQHFTSQGEIYWFRTVGANSDPFGPFVNRNHFAGFVELTLPMGLALMVFRGIRRDVFPLATLLTVVPVSAMILSGSRAGIICLAFEVGVLALFVRMRRSKEGPRMVVVAVIALAALALIVWVGAGKAIERFSALHSNEVAQGRRMSMIRGAVHVFLSHPIIGCGIGTIVAAYPRYETVYDGKVVDHVHDDYVEELAETGLLGGFCGLAFLWLLFRDARKCFAAEQGHFSRGLHVGAIVALSGILLHSFVDFNLHIPSNALLFLLAAYIATSAPLASEAGKSRQRSRGSNAGIVAERYE
jgi:O-antigen ligase